MKQCKKNLNRANDAREALDTFTVDTYGGRHVPELENDHKEETNPEFKDLSDLNCAVSDLICNLGHYCDQHGLNFLRNVQMGIENWRGEQTATDKTHGEPTQEFNCTLTLSAK